MVLFSSQASRACATQSPGPAPLCYLLAPALPLRAGLWWVPEQPGSERPVHLVLFSEWGDGARKCRPTLSRPQGAPGVPTSAIPAPPAPQGPSQAQRWVRGGEWGQPQSVRSAPSALWTGQCSPSSRGGCCGPSNLHSPPPCGPFRRCCGPGVASPWGSRKGSLLPASYVHLARALSSCRH